MIYEESKWQVGTTGKELPLIIRSRSSLPDQSYAATYSNLIIITWAYSGTDRGMPDSITQEAMDIFEDNLDYALKQKKTGILAATITGNSQKEWRYYSLDPQEFMFCLNKISDSDSPYPIELQKFNDPNWEALTEILSN